VQHSSFEANATMTDIAEKLKSQLLELPVKDRAELAYCLIDSLDESDEEIGSSFEDELERRWQEIESGKVVGVQADVVFEDM
jgi:putative addiction module component (TIGR02574 family)